jgi:hypothetical protein
MAIVPNLGVPGPVDRGYNTESRVAANAAAVMALTPAFPGEIVRAADTGQRYRGLAIVAGAWGMINVDM